MKQLNPGIIGKIVDLLIPLFPIFAMISLIVFSSKLLFLILMLSGVILFALDVAYFVKNTDFNDWD